MPTRFIDLNFNCKTESTTLGQVELTYPDSTDTDFIRRLLKSVNSAKEITLRLLYKHLKSPKLSFEDFSKVSVVELQVLAGEYVKQEPVVNNKKSVFIDFKETTDEGFFANFKKSLEGFIRRQDEWRKKFLGLSTVDTLLLEERRRLNNIYAADLNMHSGLYLNAVKAASPSYSNLVERSIQAARPSHLDHLVAQQMLSESLIRPLMQPYHLTSDFASQVISPQLGVWQDWTSRHRHIFNPHQLFWDNFSKNYDIAEEEAVEVLARYKWFVSASLSVAFVYQAVNIGRKKGNQRKAINSLFVDHFSSNNFRNLSALVNGWKENKIFKPRMRIFRDCVATLRNARGRSNPSNLVLPVLIAQIDGVSAEYLKGNGLVRNKQEWRDSNGNKVKWKEWFKNQTPDGDMEALATDLFINVFFQEAWPGVPLKKPFTLSRHKIMHGESIRYGRIDNTIRAFLILDFIANLD